MKKSQSCPSLQNFKAPSVVNPTATNAKLPKAKSNTSINTMIASGVGIGVTLGVINSIGLNVVEKKIINNLEYQAIIHTPAYNIGLCSLQNGEDTLSSPPLMLSENDKNLGACLATPCETEELREGPFTKQRYIINDPDRAGELVCRIRRRKKNVN